MSIEIKRLGFELEKARDGLAPRLKGEAVLHLRSRQTVGQRSAPGRVSPSCAGRELVGGRGPLEGSLLSAWLALAPSH